MKNIRTLVRQKGIEPRGHRALTAKGAKVDREKRTISFPFSSEQPVERWYGNEILSHDAGACDFSRLNNGASLLFNHDMDDYRGVVENAWLESKEKRNYCTVRFGKSPEAEQLMSDVEDEIITNVSFMYCVDEIRLSVAREDAPDDYLVTKYLPLEVSFVTIPADATVGVGRSQVPIKSEFIFNKNVGATPAQNGGPNMRIFPKMLMDEAGDNGGGGGAPAPRAQGPDVAQIRADAEKQIRERTLSIMALGERYKKPELARQLIEGGKSLDEARGAFLEAVGAVQKPVADDRAADIGLSQSEIHQFSFLRAVRAMMEPQNHNAQEAAKFEREVSDAAVKKTGKAAKGFLVPFDVLRAPLTYDGKAPRRDMVAGTGSAGGDLVATNLLAASFIDILRNKSALTQLGVTVFNGLVGNIAIPRQTGASTAYWIGEGGTPTEGQQTLDQVTMTPKTIAAFTDFSRQLFLQSSMDVESFVRNDIAQIMALGLDLAGLYGSGSSNQPLGLKGTSGINTTDLAAAAPTWAEIVGMETKVGAANADIGSMKYLVNATGRGALKTTPKVSNQPIYLMQDDGSVNGYGCGVSNQVASGDFWFGVWSQLIVGYWGGLDLMVDPYTGALAGNVRVIGHQSADIAVRQAPAFTRANDTL